MCPGAREGKGLRRREPHPLRRTLDTSALTKTARSSCCDSALSSATSAIPSGWRRECKSKVGWLCCGVNGWLVGCVVELRRGWGRGCVAGTNRIQQTSGRRPPRRQREQGAAGRVEGGAAHGTINRHPATINRSKTRMCHDIGLQAHRSSIQRARGLRRVHQRPCGMAKGRWGVGVLRQKSAEKPARDGPT